MLSRSPSSFTNKNNFLLLPPSPFRRRHSIDWEVLPSCACCLLSAPSSVVLQSFSELAIAPSSWLWLNGDRHHDGLKRPAKEAITPTQRKPSSVGQSNTRQKHQASLEKKTHSSNYRCIAHRQMAAQNRKAPLGSVPTLPKSIRCSWSASIRMPADPIPSIHPKRGVPGHARHGDESTPKICSKIS